jgi:UDP-N-acetylmuramoylalanine--D-glutamate ligase
MARKVLVLGYGVSGKASAALLKKQGAEVVVADRKEGIDTGGVPFFLDWADLPLDGIDQVILSPGVSPEHPIVVRARGLGIEVVGEAEFAMRQVGNRCVGITGTNGKTTVTLLVAHVLNSVGLKANAVGNMGSALTEQALKGGDEILVVELSSFQLETMVAKRLEAAVYLNMTPDHLDRYGSMWDYAAAKARIQDCLVDGGRLFVSKQVMSEYGDLFHRPVEIFDAMEESVAPFERLRYIQLGVPEQQNVKAAFALCSVFGVSSEQFQKSLATFRKPPHRIEWLGEKNGVHYYNDSKATNIDSVMYAIALFEGPIVLIAGGVDKGASYAPWIESFRGKVRAIVAYGEAAPKMESELAGHFVFKRVDRMAEAVAWAKGEAKGQEIVLLSPGCSSYDQFRSYAHRGDEFKRLVEEFSNG